MTDTQIKYQQVQEDKRHNETIESLNLRSQAETERHQRATEDISRWQVSVQEKQAAIAEENAKTNAILANIKQREADETARHNLASEKLQLRQTATQTLVGKVGLLPFIANGGAANIVSSIKGSKFASNIASDAVAKPVSVNELTNQLNEGSFSASAAHPVQLGPGSLTTNLATALSVHKAKDILDANDPKWNSNELYRQYVYEVFEAKIPVKDRMKVPDAVKSRYNSRYLSEQAALRKNTNK